MCKRRGCNFYECLFAVVAYFLLGLVHMYVWVEGVNREENGRTRRVPRLSLFLLPFRLLPLSWGSKRACRITRLYYCENILEIMAGRFDTRNQQHFIKFIQKSKSIFFERDINASVINKNVQKECNPFFFK